MNRKITVLCIALLLLFTMILTTACGGNIEKLNPSDKDTDTPDKQGQEKADTPDKENIKISFWRAGTDEMRSDYWDRVISEFKAENENVDIELTSIPWGNEIETKLNAAYASDTAPDIISHAIAAIPQRAGLGQFASLDEYMADWDQKDNIIDNILELGSYKGKVYGIGFVPNPHTFVWRKDFFEEAGLDPERPPETWEGLADYAVKLTKKEGNLTVRAGFHIPTANGYQRWQAFALQNGADLVDIENNEPLFDSPESIEAVEFLTDMVLKGVSIPADQYKEGTDPFESGQAAMTYSAATNVANLIKENPELEDKIGFAGPHGRKQKATFSGLDLLFLSSDSKYKDTGWDFIKFTMTDEETWKRYEEIGSAVVLKSLEERFIEDDPQINEAVIEAIEFGRGAPMVPYANKLWEFISQGLEQAYYGQKSPEQAMKDAADDFKKEVPNLIN